MNVKRVHESRTKEQAAHIVNGLKYGAVELTKAESGLVVITRVTDRDRRNGEWR